MAKEWVDHSLDIARKAETKMEAAERALTKADHRLNDTLGQLVEVEKEQGNAESVLKSFERQAVDALEAQRKADNKMALTVVELKQAKKQLEAKESEMSQAEQAAYDAGSTKAAESLTT